MQVEDKLEDAGRVADDVQPRFRQQVVDVGDAPGDRVLDRQQRVTDLARFDGIGLLRPEVLDVVRRWSSERKIYVLEDAAYRVEAT